MGLDEIYFSDQDGTIGYRIGTLQLTFALHAGAVVSDGWSRQLGWQGGDQPTPSWGVELSGTQFRRSVASMRAARIEAQFTEPKWVGYWSYPVRDPMGNTVEVSTPGRGSWPRRP